MSLTILAIDDSRTMRALVKQCLEEAGFSAVLAEDGVAGLEQLQTCAPDAIITDINMPRLDGFGVIEGVRRQEHARLTPILVLTTESSPDLRNRARAAGATGWIVKPFDPQKLISTIRRVT